MILINLGQHNSPTFYAAAEEWLVRHLDCTRNDYLMLYINNSCVVCGKNQNVYKEVNFNWWYNHSKQVIRRISGGGTVYHDEGNLNFVFFSAFAEHKINNYKWFNEPIRRVLQKCGVSVELNTRNDMLFQGRKISGNAQFTNRKNILSHGTLLVNSKLDDLRSALKENTYSVEGRMVDSVRSKVANITEFSEVISSANQLSSKISEEICEDILDIDHENIEKIKNLEREKYETYSWRFGRSPECTIKTHAFNLRVNEGLVEEIIIHQKEYHFIKKLVHQRMEKEAINEILDSEEVSLLIQALT
ncbi:MAG: lipoate--protein ligase [Chitinophagales bacterium]|nr:lipoate--protein ligase [Chitinophagales bacterium]MDW8272850.1 lipoate--protein ligase [Chitinophagales bacterium]